MILLAAIHTTKKGGILKGLAIDADELIWHFLMILMIAWYFRNIYHDNKILLTNK